MVQGAGFRAYGFGCGVQGLWQGVEFRIYGRVWVSGFMVSGDLSV
jgi:hypothetical protein